MKTRAPLWRLVIHDWSKLTPSEWTPYVHSFYTDRARVDTQPAFDRAWLHHQHHNPHHWQHWVLREDSGTLKSLEMPEDLVREMVADWMGAGRAITGKWEVNEWYAKNHSKMVLAPETQQLVETLLQEQG